MSRILIADDDVLSCKLLGSLVAKWGYDPRIVNNGVDAKAELLKPDAPQLAILDWMMPGLDGIDVIQELRATHRTAYTYILMLTSKGHKEDLLHGLEAGADDYLKKPFNALELRARLRVGDRILDLERRLVSALETTEFRATHDLMSGLYNRPAILDLFNREAVRCARAHQPLSVLILDVDKFKSINDTYGHLVGDEVIKQIPEKMHSALRAYDLVGRFGGEEFLILAPNCTGAQAKIVAERVRLSVAKDKFVADPHAIPVTVSIGISTIMGGGIDLKTVLHQADLALYEAKHNGRNRVECYAAPEKALAASAPPALA